MKIAHILSIIACLTGVIMGCLTRNMPAVAWALCSAIWAIDSYAKSFYGDDFYTEEKVEEIVDTLNEITE